MNLPPDDPVRRAFTARPDLWRIYSDAMALAERRRARMTRMGLTPAQQQQVNARALKRLLNTPCKS